MNYNQENIGECQGLSSFQDAIRQEIKWCSEDNHTIRDVSDEYKRGYINGLKQAQEMHKMIGNHTGKVTIH